jgi:hypothetical protein
MGFLDDAIREHLELKRRRGADPAEIERAEREALGPARRAPEPADGEHYHDEPLVGDAEIGYAPEQPPEVPPFESWQAPEHVEETVAYHEPAPAPEFLEPEHPPEPPHAAEPPQPEPEPPLERHYEEAPPPEAPPPHAAPEPPPAGEHPPHLSQPTQEYEVEFEEEHEPGHEGEDVLEETPEFLQDTPDHDRLWFEQKPPRDFDFDR